MKSLSLIRKWLKFILFSKVIIITFIISLIFGILFGSRLFRHNYEQPILIDDEDKKHVLRSVKYNPVYLYFISKELRNDYEIVMESVKSCYFCLEFASERLRDNKDIVLQSVKTKFNPGYHDPNLKYASERLKDDIDIAVVALQTWEGNIKYVSTRIKKKLRTKKLPMTIP
jgi:hypothetical protein